MKQIGDVLEANRRFRSMHGTFPGDVRAKFTALFRAYFPDIEQYLDSLTDGEMLTLTSIVEGSETERECVLTIFAFLVGYHLRHDNVRLPA